MVLHDRLARPWSPLLPDTSTARPDASADALAAGRRRTGRRRSTRTRVLAVVASLLLLAASSALSLFVGSGDLSPQIVLNALMGDGTTTNDLLVRDYRVPRTILAVLAGLALGLAGVVMQALTRNPLADPGLLGVNAGAYFAVVVGTGFFGAGIASGQIVWGVVGAGIAAAVVYLVGTTGPAAGTPVKLVLAGVAIGAVLSGFSQAITFANPTVFDRVRFWSAGSLQGRQFDSVHAVWLLIVVAAVAVLLLSRSLNALTMGEEVARALGTNIPLVRGVGFVAITLLCGAATAAVGPITFVGLVVPFVARFTVGVDHRWIIAFSLVAGPALVLLSDVLGRVLVGSELPVGVVTAFVGAPVLIALVRRTRMRSL
ncbi:iron chelate uptake ABC transporter family permease subunit [Agrococcus sp. Marseille-P2731]|uniref:iron chelate uptake ABC transporter family permease subunit n=1 Tax=Agrococcus sp. Marseille-P2731 TaxID=1841862 RepID=UPI001F188C4A|nr:iron chelate uptake ABC transporter family permease subunit [Agrococcus sp. Marseille-P2731]